MRFGVRRTKNLNAVNSPRDPGRLATAELHYSGRPSNLASVPPMIILRVRSGTSQASNMAQTLIEEMFRSN